MEQPRVSVIIRTFDRPEMVRRALRSVGEQTWPNREAVIVNDGGCDVSDVIDELRPLFPSPEDVVYLHYTPENKPGRCIAGVRAVEASTGEWICYLDDDDFYYPDHMEALMEAAAASGAKVLYTDAARGHEEPVGPNGEYVVTTVGPGPSQDFSRAAFYQGCYIHLSTFCHHRSVFEVFGGFDPEAELLEDLDLFFRYSQDHHFHHVKKVTAQFQIRTDGTNAVTAMRQEFAETRERLLKKYLHTVVQEILGGIHQGGAALAKAQSDLAAANERIARLEAQVRQLEELAAEKLR